MAENANQMGAPADVTDYRATQTYKYDAGLIALPTAGAAAGHKVVRLHGGMGIRNVDWTAARTGKPPVIPALKNTGRDTLLGGDVVLNLPTPTGDGPGYCWRVSGSYGYVQYEPRIAGTDTLVAGGYPFVTAPNDAVANAMAAPGLSAISSLDPEVDDVADVFAKRMAEYVDHGAETYVWPYTLLPPKFTNDYLIGG